MKIRNILISLMFLMPLSYVQAEGTDHNSIRANIYNRFFFPSGNTVGILDKFTEIEIPGTRNFKTVLPGVLYRGGSRAGHNKPLSQASLLSLCEAGFSTAVYAYDVGYSDPGPIQCVEKISGRKNTLIYIAGRAQHDDFKRKFLNRVHDVILDADMGPVYEHCWNGFHASGELAAVALRQFCDMSGPDSFEYWKRNQVGNAMIRRMEKFIPDASLKISTETKAAICK